MNLEEKIRRRLAPFVIEGRISAPKVQIAAGAEDAFDVDVRAMDAKCASLQADLAHALRDLGSAARLRLQAA
jgi:hypothetical protein